ncbi:hypothetical protein B296_00013384 [Ensete ventricosum]|uniref:Uncharacterized protein n=1 Tax=Ensete ventricosum TaxID=4639 RepID=A0A426ZSG9_ENSVE|nr:hypothetical protein B296_00013384 [Ensete ventricosum]
MGLFSLAPEDDGVEPAPALVHAKHTAPSHPQFIYTNHVLSHNCSNVAHGLFMMEDYITHQAYYFGFYHR